jgi:hypothetical protein
MGVKLGNGKWAIKEDKLLAYNDNSGRFFNKEFDFSRGSSATYVAKDGLIKVSGVTDTELVTNGDFATDSDWQKSSTATISNGSAHIVSDGSYQYVRQSSVLTVGKKYRVEYEIVENNSGNLKMSSSFGSNFSPISSTVGFHSFEAAALITTFYIERQTACDIKIDNVSVVEIQTDVPRIDFTDTSKGALLLEPQSTNVLEDSEITSTWTYTEFGSGSSGTITTGKTDMFGGTNAIQIDFPADAENVTLRFGQLTSSISSGSASGSVYIKLVESGSKTLQLRCSPGLRTLVNVDATNFVRYQLSGTKTNNEAFTLKLRPSEGTSSGGFSIIVCQPQEEALSYATSYIPTYGSTATRNADVCNNSGSAQDFNSEEGVLYAEIAALANDGTNRLISLSDGTDDERLFLQYSSTDNRLQFLVKNSGSTQCNIIYDASDLTAVHKVAAKYKLNDFALWVDGVEIGTDTSGNVASGLSKLQFDRGYSGLPFYGKVREVQVFTEALTDEQLQKLTS